MDIFFGSIPSIASESEVRDAIDAAFRRTDFNLYQPVRFHFRLFKTKAGHSRGIGILTLPTERLGAMFLRVVSSLVVRGTYVSMRQSNQPIDPSILRLVTGPDTSPAPETLESRRQRESTAQLLEEEVKVAKVQFGWERRDNRLSIEWEHSSSSAHLAVLPDAQQLEVTIAVDEGLVSNLGSVFGVLDIEWDASAEAKINIPYSHIQYLSTHASPDDNNAPVIIISCYLVPNYYHIFQNSLLGMRPVTSRRSALKLNDSKGRPHHEIAAFCTTIRLVCTSSSAASHFRQLLVDAGLRIHVSTDIYRIVHDPVWTKTELSRITAWRKTLPFFYAYLVESLIHSLAVDPRELWMLKEDIEALISTARQRARGREYAAIVLREFEQEAKELFGVNDGESSLLECFRTVVHRHSTPWSNDLLTRRDDEGIFLCLHVFVTPTQIHYRGPIPERSNRVIRSFPSEYHHHFVRVSFVEEGEYRIHHSGDYDFRRWVHERFGSFLKNELPLAGRPFRFLAYSQSALKGHSVWFMRPFKLPDGAVVDVPYILRQIGKFDDALMRCPARYAARVSQAFTTTDPTTVEVKTLRTIPDIGATDPVTGTKYNFTDGVGTMSPDFARLIHHNKESRRRPGLRLYHNIFPRALQIRFQGSKGVISVDHELDGQTVCLRPSMIKFTGVASSRIEIAKVFEQPGKFYLNRPLIMLLEGLGVPYATFKKYQEDALATVQHSTDSIQEAALFLAHLGLGGAFRVSSILLSLWRRNIRLPESDFFDTAMAYARNDAMREMKYKSRIPIPNAWNLVGVADVHRELKEGDIFVCIREENKPPKYLSGRVVVSRSPCIHPGDIQIANAIGKPRPGSAFDIEPLENTLVFSTNGMRPLPSYLGGGDLDGDEYSVIPLDEHPGFNFTPANPSPYTPAVLKTLPRACTQADVADFVMDYIVSDNLGMLSITWRIIADLHNIYHPDCLRLADLHSKAVDFPKSGNSVPQMDIPRRPNILPDWHAPETMTYLDESRYYKSQKAIGKLFRAIGLIGSAAHRTTRPSRAERRERATPFELTDSHAALIPPHNTIKPIALAIGRHTPQVKHAEALRATFLYYQAQLQALCSVHNILPGRGSMLSEEEVFVGTIIANTSQPRKREDEISKVRDAATLLVKHVRESLFVEDPASEMLDSEKVLSHLAGLYWGWKRCDAGQDVFGAKSFGWILLGVCLEYLDDIDKVNLEAARMRMEELAV
ncbi:RdRP-domain-containing protein [Cylindrobasidium torrendii FP15055 ss-10]|uniref:RNA-dependent RNA polymerase n=1 Tax=Cylindrobasidium torrendii FP15055 ss-10 TaxID=1314674 RepID=A0A0D7B4V1_9AGAR|nr:RdRP-domain-containing protein [Cylindrobasidium torrendii FP15055 ss-10]